MVAEPGVEAPRLSGIPADLVPTTVAAQLLARLEDGAATSVCFEDQTWSWAEHVAECTRRAAWLESAREPGPFHIGVLLENVPDFVFFLGAAGLCGAVIVALNPTRRGAELARDIAHTDCQLLITESTQLDVLEGVELTFGRERVHTVDSPAFRQALEAVDDRFEPLPASPDDLFMLVFTSGTSGAPKAVRFSNGKTTSPGKAMRQQMGFTADDVVYVTMPLFHSNAVLVGWGLALATGATIALRRRFSASGFLPDVRKYGVTYFNYVGKPLSYILATPEQPNDADNTLRLVIGNEAADRDVARFGERFGCHVLDGFGSTEGGVFITRTPDTPHGSLGKPGPGVLIVDSETGHPCPPGKFDDEGRLLNPDEAIGELVNTAGRGTFEGYYRNDDADAERLRNGWYWSGDLAYADDRGFVYFAGRTLDWLRVDGENFAAAPVERVLQRDPNVMLAAVYAVPAVDVGDEVMAALLLREGSEFDPAAFARFLGEQSDLGSKWAPRYVRVAHTLPQTETNKILKRQLARERWSCDDPVWFRPAKELEYVPLTPTDAARIADEFAVRNRANVLSS